MTFIPGPPDIGIFLIDCLVTSRLYRLFEELSNEVVVAKFATTSQHGAIEGKTQTHMVEYYNLDMIISAGYRVKSKNGIIFRKLATSILKDYMMKVNAFRTLNLLYISIVAIFYHINLASWHFPRRQIDRIKVDTDTVQVSCWYKVSSVPGGVLII